MNDESAFRTWEADVQLSARRTQRTKKIIVALLLLPFAPAIWGGKWATVLFLAAQIAILILAIRYMVRPRPATETIEPPSSNPPFDDLEETVGDFAERLGIYREEASLRVDPADFSLSPSIRKFRADPHGGARTYVHIPLGFLKFHSSHPDEARAILGHEIAHIRQGDWELWAELSSYLTIFKWLLLGSTLLAALLFAAAFADILGAASGAPVVAELGIPPGEKIRRAREALDAGIVMGVAALGLAAIQFGIAHMLIRRRAASESLADRAAALLTSPATVARAIQRVGKGRPWWAFLAPHPRNARRLALLGESRDPAVQPPGAPPAIQRIRAAFSGNGLHRLFGLAGVRPEWARLAAVTAMLLLTGPCAAVVHNSLFPAQATPSYFDYAAMYSTPGWWDWLTDLREWAGDVWLEIRDAFPSWLHWSGCLSAALAVALLAFRRDGVAIVAGIALTCLLSAAGSLLIHGAHEGLLSWLLQRSLLNMLNETTFFLALSAGLTARLGLGKSLTLAVLASVCVGSVLGLVHPRSWVGNADFLLTTTSAISSNLALALALMAGNFLATVFEARERSGLTPP